MADEEQGLQEVQSETPATETTPPVVAADPREAEIKELKLSVHGMSTQLESLSNLLNVVMTRPAQGPAQAQIEDVSDEELQQAVLSGENVGPKVRKLLAAERERIKRDMIDPLQQTGLESIAGLTKQMALAQMPHYKKYQREVDEALGNLPANARLNGAVYKAVYDSVIGGHLDELVKEGISQQARRVAQAEETQVPGRRGGKGVSEVPRAEDLGPGTKDALEVIGKDEEQFAKRLGYKSWADYIEVTKPYQ